MLALLFVLFAVAMRFLPHIWHFTPVGASLLFFGARGSRRQIWLPLVLLAASDVVLTKVVYTYPFYWDNLLTWVWYGAMLWLGTGLRDNARPVRVLGAALTCSVSFFLVSNFGSWAVYANLYPRSFHGLMMSYVAGLPFFRWTAESDLLFTAVMFATPAVLQALNRQLHKAADDHIAAA